MSINYESRLRFGLPTDGDQSWGNALRGNFEAIGQALTPDNVLFVSPSYNDTNLRNNGATQPRHFTTIQAAINAAPANTGYFEPTTIVVYPGTYQENLVITKSVCVRAAFGPTFYRGLGGAMQPRIIGLTATQAPLVTVVPPNGVVMAASFIGLFFENQYNAAAGAINNAYMLRVTGQATYGGTEIVVGFADCVVRMQTMGAGNDWAHGFWASGFNQLHLQRCKVAGLNYGGAGVARVFNIAGDNANGKTGQLIVDGCDIANFYTGAGSAYTVYADNKATAVFQKSTAYRNGGAYAGLGGTGVNTVAGLAADAASYGNILSTAINFAGL